MIIIIGGIMAKTFSLAFMVLLIITVGFIVFESEITRAVTDSINVDLSVTAEITLTAPTDVTLSSIAGITGGSSTGTAAWTVVSNNNTGYTLTLYAAASPAMAGTTQGDTIADYTEASAGVPDYTYVVDDGNAEFGYAIMATGTTITTGNIDASFKNNASACNTGSSLTDDKCYISTNTSGSPETLATTSAETAYNGEAITLKFQVEIDPPASGNFDDEGYVVEDDYRATLTMTATNN